MHWAGSMFNELVDMLKDWPVGTIAAILFIVVAHILAGLLVWGIYVAIDSWFMPRQRRTGKVTGKTFTPAHSTTIYIYNSSTKTSMPHYVHHPDIWEVLVDVQGRGGSLSVSEEFYDTVAEGSMVWVDFVSGRLSGDLYVKDLALA